MKTRRLSAPDPKIEATDVAAIREALTAGLPLTVETGAGTWRFSTAAEITKVRGNALYTSHLTANCQSYQALTVWGVRRLAAQAREKLARKDEILAEQTAARAAFYDR